MKDKMIKNFVKKLVFLVCIALVFVKCISLKNVKDKNSLKAQINKEIIDSTIYNLNPKCISLDCDSIVHCYQEFYSHFPGHGVKYKVDYYKMVDCAIEQANKKNSVAKMSLHNYYSAVLVYAIKYNMTSGTPYKMEYFRGEDAFKLALKFYKMYITDPGEFAFDPSESFRYNVMEGMIKSINGKPSTLLENESQLFFNDKKFHLIKDPLVYTKSVKNYWLNLYEKALAENTMLFREYGDMD